MSLPVKRLSNVSFRDEHPAAGDVRSEILAGLEAQPKSINPKYFYDTVGSQLFEQITQAPEYYPTRTEKKLLDEYQDEIAEYCGSDCIFIEPGSGNCEKVRLLLSSFKPAVYVPIDIAADFLKSAAMQLGRECPWLKIQAVCADFNQSWSFVDGLPAGKKVVFYPGSTIGNLEPDAALRFLKRICSVVGSGGGALIGVDLHKSSERLNAAYNDAEGVTADFNFNALTRVNEVLDAEFDRAEFEHKAFYNTELQRIEMHLVSRRGQSIRCNGSSISMDPGESIHTENSYKYSIAGFSELAASAGLQVQRSWVDEDNLFSVHYLNVR
ncbi:MAG: dimethylhistidine N-methyltransferase [Halieaceae bacterium]|jgi:dimethylhistidine N-methyltransferase